VRGTKERLISISLLTLTLLSLLLPGAAIAQGRSDVDYIVQPGDWLAKIATDHYGDDALYPAIILATNAKSATDSSYATITDPYLIEPGWKLYVPDVQQAKSALTVGALENAAYISEWTAPGKATLADGKFSESIAPGSATKINVTLLDRLAFGHVSDSTPFAAAILVTDPGGSGTFYDLAIVVERDGNPVNVAVTGLGDRVVIESLAVENGEIVVQMVKQGPDDPMCCPTQRLVERYALQGDQLAQLSSRVVASDIAGDADQTVPSDLVGMTWEWERFLGGDGSQIAVDDPSRYTLTLLPDGTYQIKADCNVAGGAYTLDGSHLTLEPGPTTLAECGPDSLYNKFLANLGHVRTYVMDDDKLVLNLWADAGNMVFRYTDRATASMSLEDTLWWLDAYANEKGTLINVLPDTEITIEFQADQIGGSAGCNRYFASYQLNGSRLTVGLIGATQMACGDETSEQERLYLTALEGAVSYKIVDDQLQLVDEMGKTVLTFDKATPAPLTGSTWKLIAYHNGKSALVSALAGTEITALFDDDGKLSGSAGCNGYTAGYEINGDAIEIGPVAATRKMCARPEGIMEQEHAYLAALGSAVTYRIKGNELTLIDADGTRVATFDVTE
jgi:heat shock protein HslJ